MPNERQANIWKKDVSVYCSLYKPPGLIELSKVDVCAVNSQSITVMFHKYLQDTVRPYVV